MIQTTQTWKIGDCLDLLPGVETGSVDLIMCDLPYGTTACSWDSVIPFEPLWKEWKRITKDNAAIVLTASQPFTTDLINSNREMFRYEWIWQKSKPTNFFNANKMPMKEHENILIFYKSLPTYNPIMQKRSPSGMSRCKYPDTTKTVSKGVYGTNRRNPNEHRDVLRYPGTIQKINNEIGLHPTQKPVALFEYLIKTYTNEGDLVHDSCLGSGTTLEACRRTNRNCIGFELSSEWEHLYADRCMAHTPTLQSYFDGK